MATFIFDREEDFLRKLVILLLVLVRPHPSHGGRGILVTDIYSTVLASIIIASIVLDSTVVDSTVLASTNAEILGYIVRYWKILGPAICICRTGDGNFYHNFKMGPLYCNLYLLSVISYIKRGFVRVCVSPLPQLQTVIKRLIMSKEAF